MINLEEKIEDLNKRIAALQAELERAKETKVQCDRISFSNEQIVQGGLELLKSKLVVDEWDRVTMDECREEIWTESQKRAFRELPPAAADEVFRRYLRQCCAAMEDMVYGIDEEEVAACRDFTIIR